MRKLSVLLMIYIGATNFAEGDTMWKYQGKNYYAQLRNDMLKINEDSDLNTKIQIYERLPSTYFEMAILDGRIGVVPRDELPLNAKYIIANTMYPLLDESQVNTMLNNEIPFKKLNIKYNIQRVIIEQVPVKIIFDRTKKIIIDSDYQNFSIDFSSELSRYSISHLFDTKLWPDLPGRPISQEGVKERKKEFYQLISMEDVNFIKTYIMYVMAYSDGIPPAVVDGKDKDKGIVDTYGAIKPYVKTNLDNWETAWNELIPLICDSFIDPHGVIEGCEDYQIDYNNNE